MFALIITIHVISCALLILIVLIQQGRGGGLVDSLSSAESIFGTKTNAFLIKSTSVLAVIFFITCLSLAFLSIQKNKSLIETSYKPSETTETKTTQSQGMTSEAKSLTETKVPVTQSQADQKVQQTPIEAQKKAN